MPGKYPFSVGYEAVFENAVVCYYEDGFDDRTETKLVVFSDENKEEIPLPQANYYEGVIKHVLQCLRTGESSCLDIQEAANTLKTVLLINQQLT